MGLITKPNTFTAGTTIVSSEVNSDFDTLYNEVNGSLDNANIKVGAAIADTKLDTISSAGKVLGAALNTLSGVPSGAGYIPANNEAGGRKASFTYIIDGGGSAIGTGWVGDFVAPYACDVERVYAVGDTQGYAQIDIRVANYASISSTYPITASITSLSPVTLLTSAYASLDTTLAGWSTAINQYDLVGFYMTSCTDTTMATISMIVRKK